MTETLLSNYTDGNKLYSIGKNLDLIKGMFQKDFKTVTEWFYDNYKVLNPKKCHYICLGKNSNNDMFWFHNLCLENSNEEVILDVTIDNKLTFDIHKMYEEKLVKNFVPCRDYLIIWKLAKNLFFIGMIKSQFSYFPLILMFFSRNSNNLIDKIHRPVETAPQLQPPPDFG